MIPGFMQWTVIPRNYIHGIVFRHLPIIARVTLLRATLLAFGQSYDCHSASASMDMGKWMFLHDRPWILPWIKSISNELDITIHVIAPQVSGNCDVIGKRSWRDQQNENRASETRGRCVKLVVFIVIYGFVISCKKQNNVCTLVTNRFCAHLSAETVRHSSTCIILYIRAVLTTITKQNTTDPSAYLMPFVVITADSLKSLMTILIANLTPEMCIHL